MRTLGTPKATRRRIGAALAGAAAVIALSAPAAQADFTLPQCGGSGVDGIGSTFQGVAQGYFKVGFQNSDQCPGVVVTYNSTSTTGSGAGRKAMGSADGNRTTNNPANSRFAGTDDAPTPTEQANMNNGPTTATTDDAKIHIIPVATGAITAVINLPDACIGTSTIPAGDFDATSGRVQIPNDKLAKAFANVSGGQTWGDLLAGSSGACAATPVHRIVRQDNSGSTYVFKQFLNRILPGTFDLANNTAWPNGTVVQQTTACGTTLCSNTASGGGAERSLVQASDGGIGYLALPDARTGFDKQDASPAAAGSDDTYWLQLQSTTGTIAYKDAAFDANGWKGAGDALAPTQTAGPRGSNCLTMPSVVLPSGADPTLGDWSHTDPTGGPGYPSCALTWDLAFDDNAPVWGSSDSEQAKARTIKDYLTFAVSTIGQAGLLSNDYSPLSPTLDATAQTGVNAIGWNKSAVIFDPPPPPPTTTNTTTTTPTTPPATTPIQPPSNVFSITSAKTKSSAVVLGLQLPGAGALAVTATAKYKGKTLTFGTASASVKGGTGTVTISPSSKAKAALKKVKSLAVSLKVTFTPTGGTSNVKTKSISVKGSLKPAKKKKK